MNLKPLHMSLLLLAGSLALAASADRAPTTIAFPLLDLDGRIHSLEQNDARRVRVFVFLGTECPIARSYTPELNRLHAQFASERVELFGVISDRDTTSADASRHFKEFQAKFPVLLDASGLLADALKPTHTPEAFVLNADGGIAYRGAIDNAWEDIGRRRSNVEKHYLADAIRASLAGKAPLVAQTKAVGCFFEGGPDAKPAKNSVTFNRDIAPIVFARCMNCHREGQVAPFALTNFTQTAKRAKQIARVTSERLMPPWIPATGHTKFVGERCLTEREVALFKSWSESGTPEGNAADLPPAPQFAEGWRFGKPDLILKMREPFAVRADGPDILQNFVIPIDIAEDKLVAAIEFHPGNKRVVHHSVLFLDDKGAARRLDAATPEPGYPNFGGAGFLPSGALGGWSAGNSPRALPNDMGRYLKKGSDLVMQLHYHPSGKVETDQSEVGVYFVKRPVAEVLKERAKLVGSIWLANYEMNIPAGEANYRRSTSYTLPRDVIMVGIVPHMHLLGKSMTVTAIKPDGVKQTLIDVPRWNYNWQDEYYYERPFALPKGTRLEVTATFDNSAANSSNPSSPPRRVTWGEGTLDEMLYCFFLVTAEQTEDLIHVIFDNLAHDSKQPRAKVSGK